jgi:hypothetical protein
LAYVTTRDLVAIALNSSKVKVKIEPNLDDDEDLTFVDFLINHLEAP